MAVSANRRWIYLGLGLAAGYGLVRLIWAPRLRPGETRLLLIGDSLAVGLAPYLRDLSGRERIAFASLAKVGTRIDQWAASSDLQNLLASFRPNMILVSLGTNDEYLQGADAVERQRAALRRLVVLLMKASPQFIIWIGPPTLPKATNGIVPMLKAEIPSRDYFPSEQLVIPRGPDGIHPTARGYAGWAGAIWHWLS
jgi:lysophospholipase L1-like esterase